MLARPFAIWLLVGSLAAPAWAQAQRGTLEGVVTDAAGLVLPGAEVDARFDLTSRTVSTVSDDRGVFRFLSVSNSLSGRHWELNQVPAVGDPTDIVQFGTGRHVSANEGRRRVALQRRVAAYLVVVDRGTRAWAARSSRCSRARSRGTD